MGLASLALGHETVPRKHYANFPWKVRRIRIYSDKTAGFLILAREQDTVLKTIRCENESHTFDPARYAKADVRKFSFGARLLPRFGAPGTCPIEDDTAFNERQEGAEAGHCHGDPLSAFSRELIYSNYI
jgi:hypothetical protein